MLLSIFTPTHRPKFLRQTYDSLKLQNYRQWEWLITPNGQGVTIPDEIKNDSRVRIIEGAADLHNVGALKRHTCEQAVGDVFIELDHDDLLVPGDTLGCIARCAEEGAGFIYSDTAVFKQAETKGQKTKYSEFSYSSQHGWENYPITVYGRRFLANKCFDITPRSLAEIYYCPDHIRCWSRKAYYEAGGHNPDLSVCDDHELMLKTYLAGAKFQHTGGCHYLYRMYGSNTFVERNKLIQEYTQKFHQSYFRELIDEWCRRHGHATFDLTKLINSGWDVDSKLLQGFGENQYGHITAEMELQRWDSWQVREFMNEAYEALIPGGYLTLVVPDCLTAAGHLDVEWKTKFSYYSMFPYVRKEYAKINRNVRCRFQIAAHSDVYASDWHRDNNVKYLRFHLCALKGQRQPAIQHI